MIRMQKKTRAKEKLNVALFWEKEKLHKLFIEIYAEKWGKLQISNEHECGVERPKFYIIILAKWVE